jgi:NADH-quinone oxidoreductase subunit M
MMLASLIIIPALGAILAWRSERLHPDAPRWIALGALAAALAVTVAVWMRGQDGPWLAETKWSWIPQLGLAFRLGLDGLSLLLILLTLALGILAVAASWTEIAERTGLFHLTLLLTLAGVVGVFLALDLFLFFFFWELMLVPMYFIIAVWGHEERIGAAIKFFIFTQGSGLLMLIAILAIALVHLQATGRLTFDYFELMGMALGPDVSLFIMLGFFVAFAVKLPAFPFHPWLPDAHTQAPTAGSVILAGVLLKTGAYGLLRFAVPLFPDAAMRFAPIAMLLGAIGVLYGAVLAFAQNDVKRLVADSSISHMGFVLLGIFAWNALALKGVVVQMIAHGISTGALFIIVGLLQERIHTRDLRLMGGLSAQLPRLSTIGLFFAIATLGLPGLGNFVGEFLVLLGSFDANPPLTIVAAAGLVAAVIYALTLVQRAFHGELRRSSSAPDLCLREMAVMAVMMILILWLGVRPQPLLDTVSPALLNLQKLDASHAALTEHQP